MNVNDQSTRVLVLSRAQACALSELLNGLLSKVSCRRDDLADVYERLSDSLWMARWLKENVRMELQAEEMISLLETVLATVNEYQWRDEEARALREVIHQLSVVPSMLAVGDSVVKSPIFVTVT